MIPEAYFGWRRDGNGIVTLTMDAPARSANTLSRPFVEEFMKVLDRLENQRDDIRGVILTSAKKSFFAGGDLDELVRYTPEDAPDIQAQGMRIKGIMRRLETFNRPVVAAINGAALGGGLEIALCCHHRIALDVKHSEIGLPEVTLGLLPGAGGVVRTVRLLGVTAALTQVLLSGRRYTVPDALKVGLVDEVVETVDDLFARSREWISTHPDACQPWDAPGYAIPGGVPATPALEGELPSMAADLWRKLEDGPLPAPRNIFRAAVEGAQVDLERAFLIESRYFVELAIGQVSKNMIQGFFLDLQHVKRRASSRQSQENWAAKKVGVIGAGMMGAGIAYVCARYGVSVVLKDVSLQAAERGKSYSERVLGVEVSRGRCTELQAAQTLARILPTAEIADFDGCDVLIEAVFEDTRLKRQVLQEVAGRVPTDCLQASNTSTIPIGRLAEAIADKGNFIGLHFFSPVDKMALLEIVVGEETSDEALGRSLAFAKQLGKTPIVVRDSRGFFTSRVITQFIDEGVAMLGEGVHPSAIERAAVQAGYPAPPLQLLDELSLTLSRTIRNEGKSACESEGKAWVPHPAAMVIDRMVLEFARSGRSSGGGFYDYVDGERNRLWPGLVQAFAPTGYRDIPIADIQERMLFSEAIDAVRCIEEGVVSSVEDANVGSLIGIGFPSWTGGVIQYIKQYQGGPTGFVARAQQLAANYGERFVPPVSLVQIAERRHPIDRLG